MNVDATPSLHDVAVTKLVRVLGPELGRTTLASGLQRLGVARIDTADDLFRLGEGLEQQGGFTATVGALLCLHAVMHGATTRRA